MPKHVAVTRWKKRYVERDGKKIHVDYDLVRVGACPVHDTGSDNFAGVNENGWVFRCAGVSRSAVKGTKHPPTPPHYFTATPPGETADKPRMKKVRLDKTPMEEALDG